MFRRAILRLFPLLTCALALAAQSLESLATAYRTKPTAARRDALLRFAAAHPKDSSGALALFAVGVTETEGKDYAAAVRRLEAARARLALIEDYVAYNLGSAQLELKQYSPALKNLEVVWRRPDPSPLGARAALLAARAYLEREAPAEAIKVLRGQYSRLPQPAGDLRLASSYEAAKDLASAADYYQRVYYLYPLSPEAREAGTALQGLRQRMGPSYPPPMPRELLGRAGKLLDGGEHQRGRAEFQALIPELGGNERELARVRVGVADYLRQSTQAAYRYLFSLEVSSPEADAERLYYLVACARRLREESKMLGFLEELNRRHPRSEWRLRALVWAANSYLLMNDATSYEPLYQACYESFPEDPLAQYCHWKVAWNAYIRRRPDAAQQLQDHLKRFPEGEKASTALYFLGRLSEKAGDTKAARLYYEKLLQHYSNYYYAALTEQRLAQKAFVRTSSQASRSDLPAGITIPGRALPENFRPSPATQRRIERSRLLASAGMSNLAEAELRFGARTDGQPHVLAMELARRAGRRGAPHQGIRYLKGVFPEHLLLPFDQAPIEMWRLAFPLPYRRELEKYCRQHDLDVYLLAGLIRQESEFDPKAISRAQARGLTQILPSTGRQLSRKLKLRYSTWSLLQPDYNLRLGTYYFRYLLDLNGGQLEATLAAYNGGRSRVVEWLNWASYEEQAEFIETIPITETRNYVQSVLRNAAMYRRLYGQESAKLTSTDGSSARPKAGAGRKR